MRTQSVHRIPRSTFVTTRNAPPDERGMDCSSAVSTKRKSKIFLATRLDTTGKSVPLPWGGAKAHLRRAHHDKRKCWWWARFALPTLRTGHDGQISAARSLHRHCERQRSNPWSEQQEKVDCFVAVAHRNDAGSCKLARMMGGANRYPSRYIPIANSSFHRTLKFATYPEDWAGDVFLEGGSKQGDGFRKVLNPSYGLLLGQAGRRTHTGRPHARRQTRLEITVAP